VLKAGIVIQCLIFGVYVGNSDSVKDCSLGYVPVRLLLMLEGGLMSCVRSCSVSFYLSYGIYRMELNYSKLGLAEDPN
jgi:hypothetical protein